MSVPANADRVVAEGATVLAHRAAQAAGRRRRRARRGGADPAVHGRADLAGRRRPAPGDRRRQRAPRAGRPRPGGGAPLAGAQPGDLHRRGRRAGPVVGARPAQRAVTTRLHLEAVRWVADIRRDPDHHARQALDSLLRQLAQDLLTDPSTQERAGAAQDAGARAAADGRHRHVAVERLPQGAARGARGRDGSAARAGVARAGGLRRADRHATTHCASGWTPGAPTSRCGRSGGTATS